MNKKSNLSRRQKTSGPNHHLWNNNGTWWFHGTEHRPDGTAVRLRSSLRTQDLEKARELRDAILAQFSQQPRTTASDAAAIDIGTGKKHTARNCLFLTSLPQTLRDWCRKSNIKGHLWETNDGGGSTGYVAEFENSQISRLALKKFKEFARPQQYLLGESVTFSGEL